MERDAQSRGKGSRSQVVRVYQRYAPVYDRVFGAVLEPGRRALAQTASGLCNGSKLSLLEVGVGTGLTLSLYPPSFEITGVDVSPGMLARARERAQRLPQRDIRLELMDGESLTFPDDRFDCVTLPYVLSVTPDPARLVAEARRVCRPGGAIIVLNHFTGNPLWWLLERLVGPLSDQVGFRSDFDLTEQILRHDWRVTAVREVNLLGLSKLVTIRNV